jgi:hypothetical protein
VLTFKSLFIYSSYLIVIFFVAVKRAKYTGPNGELTLSLLPVYSIIDNLNVQTSMKKGITAS